MLLQSFRLHITLLFGGLTLAMAAALSGAVGVLLGDRLTAYNGESLQNLARGVAGVLADGLQERIKDVELLAGSAFAAHWSDHRAEVQASLTRLQRGGSSYAWLGVVDVSGEVKIATRDMLIGENVSGRPWFKAALGGSHVGDVHPAKLLAALLPPGSDGGPVRFVDFAAPIHGPNGELRGVVGAHGNWDWAGQVVNQLRDERAFARGVRVFILDRKGDIILRPSDLPAPPAAQGAQRLRLEFSNTAGQLMTWPDGERYLTASMALPDTPGIDPLGWTIVARQPESAALAAAAEMRWRVAGLGLLSVALAMACIWVLAGRVSEPLQQIASAAERIRRGEWEVAIPTVSGSSEMRGLSGALHAMTRSLLDGQTALKTANGTLEARVSERTEALAAANQALQKLAHRDALTGLLNRRSADERLDAELARYHRHGHPLSVLLLDIDHFKRINDQRGHAVGDEVLRQVAACLASQCRTVDVVARFGGEEFLVLLPDAGAAAAHRVAEKLRTAVAAIEVAGLWPVTVSIGVAEARCHLVGGAADATSPAGAPALTASQLLRQADIALYRSKAAGRNRVTLFEPALLETD